MVSYNPIDIAKSISKFDGTSNINTFCDRIDNAISVYKLSSSWALMNFHLFIDGEVVNWWKWAQTNILAGLTSANEDVKWVGLKTQLKAFYEPTSVKKEAARKLRDVRLTECKSAGDYVAQKLSLMSTIDPKLTVEKLIKGLPQHLQNIM